MKRTIAAFLLAVAAIAAIALVAPTPVQAAKGTCANVRCAACPDGQHLRLKWPNCCECIPN